MQWKSPTLGMLLRMVSGEYRFELQFVPGLLGVGWLIAWSWQRRGSAWNWVDALSGLLLVSFVTTSYGAWPFDLVILLPAVLQRAAEIAQSTNQRLKVRAIILYSAINLTALLMNLARIDSFWFIWMAPALLLGYWWLRRPHQT